MQIRKLRLDEAVTLDTYCLEEICHLYGRAGGETAICAAMEDLAELIYRAERLWAMGDQSSLGACARQIAGIATRIGMVALARVARDVEDLCRVSDGAALGATVARLRRLGEQSLLAIWDAQDQMM